MAKPIDLATGYGKVTVSKPLKFSITSFLQCKSTESIGNTVILLDLNFISIAYLCCVAKIE